MVPTMIVIMVIMVIMVAMVVMVMSVHNFAIGLGVSKHFIGKIAI